MLTDFDTLSPSDTLSDALYKAIHSLQMTPVVRGGGARRRRLPPGHHPGAAPWRQRILQASCPRAFQVAPARRSLGARFRRIGSGRLSLIPSPKADASFGMRYLQNLSSSMGLLADIAASNAPTNEQ